jgi:hypothetical protein
VLFSPTSEFIRHGLGFSGQVKCVALVALLLVFLRWPMRSREEASGLSEAPATSSFDPFGERGPFVDLGFGFCGSSSSSRGCLQPASSDFRLRRYRGRLAAYWHPPPPPLGTGRSARPSPFQATEVAGYTRLRPNRLSLRCRQGLCCRCLSCPVLFRKN